MEKLMEDNEKLKLVKDQSDVPDDYELVEIEDVTKLSESEYGEFRALVRKAIKDGYIKLIHKIEVDKEKDIGEECVNFTSTGDVGVHRQYQMGSYTKISQRIKGCPVFELDHNEKDKRHYFLFVGPDGRWRIGPDVTSYSGSVLKNPQKNTKLPPHNGWLYYLDNKWKEAESLLVTLNVKYDKDKEEAVKFVSKGDARDHGKNRMGSYIKTSETWRGCPMFEQVDKQEDEKQHYLFVGRDGCWRVGPDVTSYSGSVLKHPKKNEEKPPKTGWLYYLDNKWNEDDSLQLITKEDVPQAKANIKNKISSSCDCTIVDHDYVDDGYVFQFKNITCLGMAILTGETAAVETSLKKGCDINYDKMLISNSSHSVSSPLMLACQWPIISLLIRHPDIEIDKRPIISLLVRHPDIEIDKRNKKGETALAIAATKPKNLEVVKILVESGAKVYLRDSKGYNPLQRAVEAGHLETAKYLHSKGANLYLHVTGKELLWKAVDKENLPMVRYLVENGASLDSPHLNGACEFGCNPFQIAVFNLSVEIVKYMIEQGADVMTGTKYYYYRNVSQTALEIAQYSYMEHMQECEREENKLKYEEVICMLKAAEAESKHDGAVNSCDCSIIEEYQVSKELEFRNLSCLGIAVLQNDIKAVETSLSKGCSINFDKIERHDYERNDYGLTPLLLASDLEMVKFLVEAGADPDSRNRSGHSLLHHAAVDGQLEILKYLLSKGAYINTKAVEMGTPLWLAAHNGNLEIVKYLANHGADLNIGRTDYESFKDNRWYSPLNAAVEEGHVDVVKFLIKQGADVDEECESDGVRWSNFEIAWRKLDDPETEQRKKPLYEEIICILEEAGVKEPDGGVIKKSVLDTLDAIMWIWAEKIDFVKKPFPSWDWPNDSALPDCIKKLKVLTERNDAWLPMLQALMEVVSVQTATGPIAMALLIYHTLNYHTLPKFHHWEELKNIIPQMLKILEIGSSYDANDIRHGNICIILSSFVGHIQRNIYAIQIEKHTAYEQEQFLIETIELILTLSLDYLFGNLKSGSKPEIAIFSLLTLEVLANEKENGDNQNTETVRKRFREYGPDDHPLLRIEKLVVSDDFAEKQAGFCAQWYLDNLWPIDNQDTRNQKIIDNTNVNVRLIPSDENKYLKVGSNGLEVRGDGPWFETAMSTVHVDEGSWYYEVTIVTGGFMQIGWATKQSEFLKKRGYGVGDDKFSQSYDGCRQVVWYDRFQPNGDEPLGWAAEGQGPISSWKPGDVIGSLIDIENKEIVFSLNGVNIRSKPYKDVFEKVNDGFFAAISLMSFQQCQVNFGKDPFKHPPEEKIWKPLNECITKSS